MKNTRISAYEYKGENYYIKFIDTENLGELEVIGYKDEPKDSKMMYVDLENLGYDFESEIPTSMYDEIAYEFIKMYIGEEYEIL